MDVSANRSLFSEPENNRTGLDPACPKVFYNEKTKQYVMYMHLDGNGYRLARVASGHM